MKSVKSSNDLSLSQADKIRVRMDQLGVRESDLEEHFIRGTGPGGQKINKTSSCVQLTHKPSGITVRCQNQRNQSQNRIAARKELCDRLEANIQHKKQEHAATIAKSRRQKAARSYGKKQELLRNKKFHAQKKILRKKYHD